MAVLSKSQVSLCFTRSLHTLKSSHVFSLPDLQAGIDSTSLLVALLRTLCPDWRPWKPKSFPQGARGFQNTGERKSC